jgi:hypothetical protein
MSQVRSIGLAVFGAVAVLAQPTAVHAAEPDPAAFDAFLDRLMAAESGGVATAKNPRSTALGPFQFLDTTFLDITRRHFAAETEALNEQQVLALRTDPAFARKAVAAFTRDNADYLTSEGVSASFTNLRLAHLVGAGAAARILKAPPASQVALWVGPAVIRANRFMAGMTVEQLIERCATEANTDGTMTANPASTSPTAKPAIAVTCDLGLASCRRWLALAKRRIRRR